MILFIAWFSATLALSAFLLFLLQPMFARMVLPLLGGTPGVWNTCVLFFQTVLLGAYAYAHAVTRRGDIRRQAAWHIALLALPALVLPVALPASWTPPDDASPAAWLLGVLLARVGLPFFAVATTAPLLQRWVAATSHAAARDPYFLYAASNAGSLLGLLAYPLLVEPSVRLADQGRWWSAGYALLVAAIAGCAVWLWRTAPQDARPVKAAPTDSLRVPSRIDRAWWVFLSAIPSSLLLGVTTYISTDLASVPLLWVIPLALYLVTFILAFATRPAIPIEPVYRLYCVLVLPLAILMASGVDAPSWLIPWHLTAFILAAFLCHRILALRRPSAGHITEYYLWMSLGGALGGVFNGLIAPLIFRSITEYPLALVLACLARVAWRGSRFAGVVRAAAPPSAWRGTPDVPSVTGWTPSRSDGLWPLGLGALVLAMVWLVRSTGLTLTPLGDALLYTIPALLCFPSRWRPVRFGLCLGAFLLIHLAVAPTSQRILHRARSFFGVHRVMVRHMQGDPFDYHLLMHGRTLHGAQSLDPARQCEPLSYFHRKGPLGAVMGAVGLPSGARVAVIGLGAGSAACYQQPGQRWTFYEIDPTVAAIARTERYFTFLSACAPQAGIVLGDGRRMIDRAPDGTYDLLIVDAFSSASIPVHLLTQEALALYVRKLTPRGVIALHISNPHFDLERVLGNACRAMQLTCAAQLQRPPKTKNQDWVRLPSQWMVIARTAGDLGALARDAKWRRAEGVPGDPVWTDDFSNLLGALRPRMQRTH